MRCSNFLPVAKFGCVGNFTDYTLFRLASNFNRFSSEFRQFVVGVRWNVRVNNTKRAN